MKDVKIAGNLVSFPAEGLKRPLDGFYSHGKRKSKILLILVHGLASNFYRSAFKHAIISAGPRNGFDVLSFNNRGWGADGNIEHFTDCVKDIDAAIAFGKRLGYREFVLMGHSTGCQKITYYMDRKKNRAVKGVILAAPSDDAAIIRSKLRSVYPRWMERARELTAEGRGDDPKPKYEGMSPRRILSLGDKRHVEAQLFDYDGNLPQFSRLKCHILGLFGEKDEYLCRSAEEIGDILRAKTNAKSFEYVVYPDADHGFHTHEPKVARRITSWLKKTFA